MCELFGLSANRRTDFAVSLSRFRKRGGGTADNPDGWGLAYREQGVFVLHKEPGPAARSARLLQLCDTIRSDLVVAHVRKANPLTATTLDNTHPFTRSCCGRRWVFAHNGKLSELTEPGKPHSSATCEPIGNTDSEHAFCYLMNQIAARFSADVAPDGCWWLRQLGELSQLVSSHGRFNFLMSDGTYLIAYGHDRLHSLERRCHGLRLVFVATEPLTQDEIWKPFAPGELRVYRGGRASHPASEAGSGGNTDAGTCTVREFSPARRAARLIVSYAESAKCHTKILTSKEV